MPPGPQAAESSVPSPWRATAIDRARVLQELEARLFTKPRKRMSCGRYDVLEKIGSGGFGVVCLGHDPTLDRPVAIKFVHAKPDAAWTRGLILEARALAALDHPNIVKVFDVGRVEMELESDLDISAKNLFIVMELIEGPTLERWLMSSRRSTHEVLRLLGRAGAGLAAAHDAGVVHRDFKPTNMMVANDGEIRILDFGLASLTAGETAAGVAEASHASEAGRGIVFGTPLYMAPETHVGELPGPAADQYAFGLVLAEALAGRNPFRSLKPAAILAAKERGISTAWLRAHGVSRRISKIIRRATSPQPRSRYEDMHELLSRLDAATQGARTMLWAGSAAILGLGATTLAAASAPEQPCAPGEMDASAVWTPSRRHAIRTAVSGRPSSDTVQAGPGFVQHVDHFVDRWTTAREAVCSSIAANERTADEQQRAKRCLRSSLEAADTVLNLIEQGDTHVAIRGARILASFDDPKDCLEPDPASLRHPEKAQLGQAERELVDTAYTQLGAARALQLSGRYEDAHRSLDSAYRSARAAGDPIAAAEAEYWLGVNKVSTGNPADGRGLLESAYFEAQGRGEESLAARAAIRLVSVFGHHLSDLDAAEKWGNLAKASLDRADADPKARAPLEYNLGLIAHQQGDLDTATEHFAAALSLYEAAGSTFNIATCLSSLGATAQRRGDNERALQLFSRAQALLADTLGEHNPELAPILANMSNAYRELGRLQSARTSLESALAMQKGWLGETHPSVGQTLINIAALDYDEGDYDSALERFETAVSILRQVHPADHPDIAIGVDNTAVVLRELGRYEEAIPHHLEALESRIRVFGRKHASVAISQANYARTLVSLGRLEQARALVTEARTTVTQHPDRLAETGVSSAQALLQREDGDLPGAVASLRRALAAVEDTAPRSAATARAHEELAIALREAGMPREAEVERSVARLLYEKLGLGR